LNCRSLEQGLRAFQVNCVNRAGQSSTFAENVRADVIKPLSSLLVEHESYIENLGDSFLMLRSEISGVNYEISNSKAKYLNSLNNVEEVLYKCENLRLNPEESEKSNANMREKLNVKMWEALRRLKKDWEEYKKYEGRADSFKTQYESIAKEILDQLQKHEEERIQMIKDSLQKFLIYEVSASQNNKYDIQQLNTAIESIDICQDVKKIMSMESANSKKAVEDKIFNIPSLVPIIQEKSNWSRLFEVYEQRYFDREECMDYKKVVEETKHYITTMSDEEYKSNIASFRQLAKVICSTSELTLIESWKQLLTTRKGRLAFIDSLEEKVNSGNTKISEEEYKLLVQLLIHLFDKVFYAIKKYRRSKKLI